MTFVELQKERNCASTGSSSERTVEALTKEITDDDRRRAKVVWRAVYGAGEGGCPDLSTSDEVEELARHIAELRAEERERLLKS